MIQFVSFIRKSKMEKNQEDSRRTDLENLVSKVESDEERALLISHLIKNHETEILLNLIKETIESYVKKGNYYRAAKFTEKLGLKEWAIAFYIRDRCFGNAARVAREAGLNERAEVYGRMLFLESIEDGVEPTRFIFDGEEF